MTGSRGWIGAERRFDVSPMVCQHERLYEERMGRLRSWRGWDRLGRGVEVALGGQRDMLQRLVLVGRYPPPYGGISVHIQRLGNRLAAKGVEVEIWDIYRCLPTSRPATQTRGLPLKVLSLVEVIASRIRTRSSVVHVHVSSGRWLPMLFPFMKLLVAAPSRRVLTIHGGAWVSRFRDSGEKKRHAILKALQNFDDIICVNSVQKQALQAFVKSRLHVIPAYLSPGSISSEEWSLPASVKTLRDQVDAIIVTSGYGDPNYEFETVLHAIENVTNITGLALGLVVSTYGRWVQPYWDQFVAMASRSVIPVVFTYDLAPPTFLAVLRVARMYVRATRTDGDAVAIREAGWAGAQVLASDCCPRPNGTVVFPTGSVAALGSSIIRALHTPEFGRLSEAAFADSIEHVLSVYES